MMADHTLGVVHPQPKKKKSPYQQKWKQTRPQEGHNTSKNIINPSSILHHSIITTQQL